MGIDKDDKSGSQPFWHSTLGIAVFTGILGTFGTVITGGYAWYDSTMQRQQDEQLRRRELTLAELKEDLTIEKEYFLKAVDAANTTEVRSRILRYLIVSPRISPEMKSWATAEMHQVETELKVASEAVASSAQQASRELDETTEKLKDTKVDEPARRVLVAEREQQQRTVAKLKAQAVESRVAAELTTSMLALANTGRICKPETVKAVGLGIDDPDQSTADSHCAGSAAGRHFAPSERGQVSWLVRREGRNFRCTCETN